MAGDTNNAKLLLMKQPGQRRTSHLLLLLCELLPRSARPPRRRPATATCYLPLTRRPPCVSGVSRALCADLTRIPAGFSAGLKNDDTRSCGRS